MSSVTGLPSSEVIYVLNMEMTRPSLQLYVGVFSSFTKIVDPPSISTDSILSFLGVYGDVIFSDGTEQVVVLRTYPFVDILHEEARPRYFLANKWFDVSMFISSGSLYTTVNGL